MFQIVLILYYFLTHFAFLQTNYQYVGELNLPGEKYYSDAMGNVYIITGNRIQKFNSKLVKLSDYSNAFLGNITSTDVSDPLRILLYFKEFNQILWLDNFLVEMRSAIRLDDLGLDQTEAICSSAQGGFWVYNTLDQKLQYFDVNLNLLQESIHLGSLLSDLVPASMLEKNRQIYLNVPGAGILVFDRFGTYSKTLPIHPDKEFQITDNNCFYFRDQSFYKYDLVTYDETEIQLPQTSGILSVMIQPEYLYLVKKGSLLIYKWSYFK